jgi:hypothetical protein
MKAKLASETTYYWFRSWYLYPILNVDELITGVLTNSAFQTYLNSKEMKLAKKVYGLSNLN